MESPVQCAADCFCQTAQAEYWNSVADKYPDLRSLWREVSALLQPVAAPVGEHSATSFANFFCSKVDSIRETTMNAPQPTIHHGEVPLLGRFQEVTTDEVLEILRTAPNITHLTPTWLVKQTSDVLAPAFTDMINRLFEEGCLPSSQKESIVGPRLNKQSLDPADLKSYRSISNISFISKLIKRIAVNRFHVHANLYQLLPVHQSAYRQSHSTETAVTVVHNDIVCATDAGQVSALVFLDLSADLTLLIVAFSWICAFVSFRSRRSCL